MVVLPPGSGNNSATDVYEVILEPGETVYGRTTFPQAGPMIGMRVFDSNFQPIANSNASTGTSHEWSWTNNTTMAGTYLFTVQNFGASCVDYDFLIRRTFCGSDDPLEDFDSCSNPVAFGALSGMLPSLAVLNGDDDFFEIDLPPGADFMLRIDFEDDEGDIDLRLFDTTDGTCGTPVDASSSVTDMETVAFSNPTDTTRTIVAQVLLFGGACNGYSMTWDTAVTPCFAPDIFENNDDICATGPGVGMGVYDNLSVSDTDRDYMYLGIIAPGQRITVGVDFVHAEGDIDLTLWDVTGACTNAVLSDASTSVANFEEVSFTNTSSSVVELTAEVYLFSGDCSTYSLSVSSGPVDGIGDAFCLSPQNSTGQRGRTVVDGDPVAANNSVVLRARDVPPGQFGIFITSESIGNVPGVGGGMGRLCLGGTIGRFQGPGQIVQVDPAGETSLPIDLTALPAGGTTTAATAGETRYFQFWHRDGSGSGPTSNLASGTRVRWQ